MEEWRPIQETNGVYEVSNKGNVRCIVQSQGHRGRQIKPDLSTWGYLCVKLKQANGTYKYIGIHRLVAQAFLPIPEELKQLIGTRKLQVNHKDENKTNNIVDNLEWCTASYNSKYGTISQRRLKTAKERNHMNAEKEIHQFDKNGNLLKVWGSIHKAAKEVGVTPGAICMNCKNKCKTIKGYIFKYAN